MTLQFQDLAELDNVAHRLLAEGGQTPVWLFEGEMGAGKTTLIKALCRVLNVVDVVQSPTFGLVNEYVTQAGEPVYHFDCYRLRSPAEALDLGIEEYFDSGYHCFVEWPERIEPLWPRHYVQIHLTADPAGTRTAAMNVVSA